MQAGVQLQVAGNVQNSNNDEKRKSTPKDRRTKTQNREVRRFQQIPYRIKKHVWTRTKFYLGVTASAFIIVNFYLTSEAISLIDHSTDLIISSIQNNHDGIQAGIAGDHLKQSHFSLESIRLDIQAQNARTASMTWFASSIAALIGCLVALLGILTGLRTSRFILKSIASASAAFVVVLVAFILIGFISEAEVQLHLLSALSSVIGIGLLTSVLHELFTSRHSPGR